MRLSLSDYASTLQWYCPLLDAGLTEGIKRAQQGSAPHVQLPANGSRPGNELILNRLKLVLNLVSSRELSQEHNTGRSDGPLSAETDLSELARRHTLQSTVWANAWILMTFRPCALEQVSRAI